MESLAALAAAILISILAAGVACLWLTTQRRYLAGASVGIPCIMAGMWLCYTVPHLQLTVGLPVAAVGVYAVYRYLATLQSP